MIEITDQIELRVKLSEHQILSREVRKKTLWLKLGLYKDRKVKFLLKVSIVKLMASILVYKWWLTSLKDILIKNLIMNRVSHDI